MLANPLTMLDHTKAEKNWIEARYNWCPSLNGR